MRSLEIYSYLGVFKHHNFNSLFATFGNFRWFQNSSSSFISFLHIYEQVSGAKVEYRAWNPFRSKLAAAILGGIGSIHMEPGCKVLYLGAASGTTVSHVSDIVGPVSTKSSFLVCTLYIDVSLLTKSVFNSYTSSFSAKRRPRVTYKLVAKILDVA